MEQLHPGEMALIACIFLLAVGLAAFPYSRKGVRTRRRIVYHARQNLAAFSQIPDATLFSPEGMDAQQVAEDLQIEPDQLAGAYLIEPVKANSLLRRSQLVVPPSQAWAQNARVVSLLVPAAAAWHGEMAPGEMVSIWASSPCVKADPVPTPILSKALVLSVQKAESHPQSANEQSYQVTLLVPHTDLRAFLVASLSQPIRFAPAQE